VALYKNISQKAEYICSHMLKTLVQPGAMIEISSRDLLHCGGAMRNFESVVKAKAVADQKMSRIKNRTVAKTTTPVDAKKVVSIVPPVVAPAPVVTPAPAAPVAPVAPVEPAVETTAAPADSKVSSNSVDPSIK